MISDELARRARALTEAGEPFVTATVVRARHPTSAQPGNVALVRADGTIEGFVGGVCAEQSVRAYSLRAIEAGEPLLLRIEPEAGEDEVGEDGAVTVRNPCLSGGALEIFLEPLLPKPRVTVLGESPIAASLRRLAAEVGLDVGADAVLAGPRAGDLALLVAAHGRDELGALRSGLELGLPYVGLVASPRRGAGVLDELRGTGVPDELLARVDTPAGVEIGAQTPAEIAVSILAQIISVRRRSGASQPTSWEAPNEPLTATDPVCGMTVAIGPGTITAQVGGETFHFCCEGCRDRFLERAAA